MQTSQNFIVIVLSGFLFMASHEIKAQFEADYSVAKHDRIKAKELIKSLALQRDAKIREFNSTESWIKEEYKKITKGLISHVRHEKTIWNDSLQSFLDDIVKKIVENNALASPPQTILVSKNPTVNAICLGEGTIVLNNGLLALVRSEEELAFVISHEIAHQELGHVDLLKKQRRTADLVYKPQEQVKDIANMKPSMEGIEKIKGWAYNISKYSRDMEKQADSLGLTFFKNVYKNVNAAMESLNALDSANFPWYSQNESIFTPLEFSKFPFRKEWVREGLKLYNKEQSRYLFFELDSLSSHPDIEERRRYLSTLIPPNKLDSDSAVSYKYFRQSAQFELLHTLREIKRFEIALFYALQLKFRFPNNAYVVETIASILLEVYRLKRDDLMHSAISRYTIGYSDELRMITNFLFNIPSNEIIELAYHFLNNQKNFKNSDQEHFYLLWQICRETKREKVQERVKNKYLDSFNVRKYSKEMKVPMW